MTAQRWNEGFGTQRQSPRVKRDRLRLARRSTARCGLLAGILMFGASCGRSPLDLPPAGTIGVTTGSAGGTATTGAAGESAGSMNGGAGAGGGSGGANGGAGASGTATPIPCGNTECVSGKQICCVTGDRRGQQSCISAGAICPSAAASIACVDNSACGAGQICCERLLTPATVCSAPDACVASPGVILCGADADCPALAPHCCQTRGAGICSTMPCPVGGGDNGPPG
jgi:hypothetical protein